MYGGYGGYGGYSGARFLAGLGGAYIFGFFLAGILVWVFAAMIKWKIFAKAGEPGWKALIPIYNSYIEYKICWKGKFFWITLGLGVGAAILWLIPLIGPSVAIAAFVAILIISVVKCMQLAHAFGKDDGFALGLMISGVALVFYILLAFDQDVVYYGPQPSPAFFKAVESDIRGMQNKQMPSGAKFDPYTGEPLNPENRDAQNHTMYTMPDMEPAPMVTPIIERVEGPVAEPEYYEAPEVFEPAPEDFVEPAPETFVEPEIETPEQPTVIKRNFDPYTGERLTPED